MDNNHWVSDLGTAVGSSFLTGVCLLIAISSDNGALAGLAALAGLILTTVALVFTISSGVSLALSRRIGTTRA